MNSWRIFRGGFLEIHEGESFLKGISEGIPGGISYRISEGISQKITRSILLNFRLFYGKNIYVISQGIR